MGISIAYNEANSERAQFYQNELPFHPNMRESSYCLIDANGVARNSASAVTSAIALPAIAASAISASAIAGGLLGIPLGLLSAREGYLKAKAAWNNGDAEAVLANANRTLFGTGFAAISGLLIANGIMSLQGTAIPAAFTSSFPGVGFAMNSLLALYGMYGLSKASQFGDQLNSKTDPQEAVQWLKTLVTLTPAELKGLDAGEIKKRLQKKWNSLEIQVGEPCAKLIRDKTLASELDSKEAAALVEEVKKANLKQQVKYYLFILIALVGIAAFIGFTVLSGPVSSILFAFGSLLWLGVDNSSLHTYISDKCWIWLHPKVITDLQEEDKVQASA